MCEKKTHIYYWNSTNTMPTAKSKQVGCLLSKEVYEMEEGYNALTALD